MAKIRVDSSGSVYNGQVITFRSPANCSQITGLKVYYTDGSGQKSQEFQFADSHGNNVGGKDLFADDVLVKVILDTELSRAYVQNADTNAYLEHKFSEKADKVKKATAGNFAGLDANGNLTDSGKKAADFVGKLNTAKAGNLAALAADGGLADSGATVAGIIAQALASGLKVETGTYTGAYSASNLNYGENCGVSLTFNGVPKLIIVLRDVNNSLGSYATQMAVFAPNAQGFAIYNDTRTALATSLTGTTFKWWYPGTLSSGADPTGSERELNYSRFTYQYIAITE